MPFIIPFIPLIAAGVGAAGVADTIYNQVNAPSAPKPVTAPTTPAPQTPAQNAAQIASASSGASNIEAATEGAGSPDYLSSILNTAFQGNPQATGNIQEAINQVLGLGAPGTSGLTPSGAGTTPGSPTTGTPDNGITALLAALRPSAGSSSGAPASSIVQSSLNNDFKGFS